MPKPAPEQPASWLPFTKPPGTSFDPYPVLADPKKIIRALAQLQDLKSFSSADAVNTTIGP